jgi:hypothetical protein
MFEVYEGNILIKHVLNLKKNLPTFLSKYQLIHLFKKYITLFGTHFLPVNKYSENKTHISDKEKLHQNSTCDM